MQTLEELLLSFDDYSGFALAASDLEDQIYAVMRAIQISNKYEDFTDILNGYTIDLE
ncbi:hypothetical protein KIPB_016557, partial [Kipferlia bialata]|eukprot:g16557.t1